MNKYDKKDAMCSANASQALTHLQKVTAKKDLSVYHAPILIFAANV